MKVRTGEVRLWLGARGLHSEAETRIRASDFTGGALKYFPAFKKLLEQYSYSIRSIAFVSDMEDILERPDVRDLLNRHRFVHRKAIDGYIIVWN